MCLKCVKTFEQGALTSPSWRSEIACKDACAHALMRRHSTLNFWARVIFWLQILKSKAVPNIRYRAYVILGWNRRYDSTHFTLTRWPVITLHCIGVQNYFRIRGSFIQSSSLFKELAQFMEISQWKWYERYLTDFKPTSRGATSVKNKFLGFKLCLRAPRIMPKVWGPSH